MIEDELIIDDFDDEKVREEWVRSMTPPVPETTPLRPGEGSLYAELVRNDVLKMVEPLLQKGKHRQRAGDGKIVGDYSMVWDSPWNFTVPPLGTDCYYQSEILFETVFKGNDLVSAHVHYAHEESPGTLYEVKLGQIHFEDDGQAVIRGQASPVECVWRFHVIFEDGFEAGNTSAWTAQGG